MARILVAEDDVHMLRIISMWLQRSGHEVCEASDGLAAREQLAGGRFDPATNGRSLARRDGVGTGQLLNPGIQ